VLHKAGKQAGQAGTQVTGQVKDLAGKATSAVQNARNKRSAR
jgi:uncharacterized protein YjbJ (UPF0337 family)